MGMDGLKAFPLSVTIPRCKESLDLSRRLEDPWAWKFVVAIMCWAAANLPDGIISGQSAGSVVEAAAEWSGESGKLWRALIASGWFDRVGSESFEIHYWSEWVRPVLAAARKKRERAKSRYYLTKQNSASRTLPSGYQVLDGLAARAPDLDLPAGHSPHDAPMAPSSPTATSTTAPGGQELIPLPDFAPPRQAPKKERKKTRQQQAYDYFRERREHRTGAPDTRPKLEVFNPRMGAVLDEVGVPAWRRIVDGYLADDGYPRTHCTPPWPIRLLLSTYARYYSQPDAREASHPVQVSADEVVLKASILEAYEAQTGKEYPWQEAADAGALRECLKFADADVGAVMARWEFALGNQRWPRCNTLKQLAQRWADVDRAFTESEQRRGDVPRIAGWK